MDLEPQTKFEKAKQASIYDLWAKLGLPGEPAGSCKSPFRADSRPSFWLSEDGKRWKDYGTGEGGDTTDFVAKALNLSLLESAEYILNLGNEESFKPSPIPIKQKPIFPDLSKGHEYDWKMLAETRQISYQTILKCVELGLVRFLDYENTRCWCITDNERLSAQVRRLDRKHFATGDAKAISLKGSWATWPINAYSGSTGIVLLCEGGPDLLAAYEAFDRLGLKIGVRAVCMLGAGQHILKDSLVCFTGSKMLLLGHNDERGLEANKRWHEQLKNTASLIAYFNWFNKAKDLNDLLLLPEFESIFKLNFGILK